MKLPRAIIYQEIDKKELKKIRDAVACPQFGDDHYGVWGAMEFEVRLVIHKLLNYIDDLQSELDSWRGGEE